MVTRAPAPVYNNGLLIQPDIAGAAKPAITQAVQTPLPVNASQAHLLHRGQWHQPKSPIAIPPGLNTLTNIASTTEIEPGWDQYVWWDLSDEVSHPFHFWRARPLDALVAIGSFQGYNLVNADTELLILADYDPRQQETHTVFAGLIFDSPTPRTLIENFLKLNTAEGRHRLLRSIESAELNSQFPPGTSLFARKLYEDKGILSINHTYATFAPVLIKILEGKPLTREELSSFDWLRDHRQYLTVRKLYLEGRVADVNANVYAPDGLKVIADYLLDRGSRVSAFYFSDPSDVLPSRGTEEELQPTLFDNLNGLPLHPDAIIQWTNAKGGIPRVGSSFGNYDFSDGKRHYLDGVDGRYAYVEMPIPLYKQWILSPDEGEDVYIEDAYERLNKMLGKLGVWIDGRIVVQPQSNLALPQNKKHPAHIIGSLLSSPNRQFGDIQRAQKMLTRIFLAINPSNGEEPRAAAQGLLLEINAATDVYGRGRLREILYGVEQDMGLEVFDDGEFDPLPRSIREYRGIRGAPSTLRDRLTELHHRRKSHYGNISSHP